MFDLLGDLYAMPIEGTGTGLAERLTSGAAFDMQPRFSPDGKWIAFASDRDGLLNLWVMKPDGSGARQVSKEKQWYVNSPTWSPDSQYLYGRKHFVKERSLGAGEIWMFHVSGARWPAGHRQERLAEGRRRAGSSRRTGGISTTARTSRRDQTFEYNKDPYGVVYAIIRRDLTNGKERTAVSEAGGSVAPRVSPDGKWLSLVRRVGGKSVLVRPKHRDRRRAAGFRPPRSRHAGDLVGLRRLQRNTPGRPTARTSSSGAKARSGTSTSRRRRATEIPFRARVEQTTYERLVFPQDVHPKQFPVRMLRNVSVAPDGSAVAYDALGHVYVRPLPTGEPEAA